MTRKPLPFVPLDSLHPGDELRIVLLTGDVCNATLVRSGTNWLTVRERETELQFRTIDVESIQLREKRTMDEVFEAMMNPPVDSSTSKERRMESNPLKWHGGKSYLAKRIIELMPPHTHYVEPFFGGGAVLFAKECEGVSEVVNDLNFELMNFWAVLRSDELFDGFLKKCEMTPFSHAEWSIACAAENEDCPAVFAAHAFFIRYRQSRQGLGKDFATLSRNRTRRGMNEQVSSWLSAIEGLPEAHERLKRVVILNADACEVIRQQDGPNTLFYLDPPYLHSTRVTTGDYECEMSEADHMTLLKVLEDIEGKFILSGYDSALYRLFMECNPSWNRVDIEIDNKASSKKTKEVKTECLWMNF